MALDTNSQTGTAAVPAGAARFASLDQAWARQLLAYAERKRDSLLAELAGMGHSPTQTEEALLAGYLLDIGRLGYALGEPLARVSAALQAAAQAYLRVFQLRGTTEAMPVAAVQARPGWQRDFEEVGTETLQTGADESLTNSRTGLLALHLALATDDLTLARDLAPLVYDPEGATYLGAHSEVCTFEDQRLAYALRDLVLSRRDANESPLPSRMDEEQRLELIAIAACRSRQSDLIGGAITRLLAFHEHQAKRADNGSKMDLFLCLPALALASFAWHDGVLHDEDVPAASSTFPVAIFIGEARKEARS